MTKLLLKAILALLGSAAIGIGLSMMLLGANATGQFFATLVNQISTQPQPLNDLSAPNVDSEIRFYAVFWIAYGVVLLKTVQNLTDHLARVPLLAALFFIGGLGRALSWYTIGEPHLLFRLLMVVELILPVAIYFLWFTGKKKPAM